MAMTKSSLLFCLVLLTLLKGVEACDPTVIIITIVVCVLCCVMASVGLYCCIAGAAGVAGAAGAAAGYWSCCPQSPQTTTTTSVVTFVNTQPLQVPSPAAPPLELSEIGADSAPRYSEAEPPPPYSKFEVEPPPPYSIKSAE